MSGYNAILNKDFVHIHDLFDSIQFKKEIEDIDLVHALIRLATNKWTKSSLKVVIENIITSHGLYPHADTRNTLKRVTRGAEFTTIMNLIESSEGDVQGLGQL